MKRPSVMQVEVLTALTVAGLFAAATAWFGVVRLRPERRAPVIAGGVFLRQPRGYVWSRHSETLLLALRVGCPYCERSMPFYKEIYRLHVTGRIHADLLWVFPDPRSAVDASHWGWAERRSTLTGYDLASLGVGATPTLALVDRRGPVLRTWVGELSVARSRRLLALLEREGDAQGAVHPTQGRPAGGEQASRPQKGGWR